MIARRQLLIGYAILHQFLFCLKKKFFPRCGSKLAALYFPPTHMTGDVLFYAVHGSFTNFSRLFPCPLGLSVFIAQLLGNFFLNWPGRK